MKKVKEFVLSVVCTIALMLIGIELFVYAIDRSPTMRAYGRNADLPLYNIGDVTKSLISAIIEQVGK